jgi:hypothetical protein
MADIRASANTSFRDYVTAGLPASGAHQPVLADIRATFGVVEDQFEAVEALATVGVKWTPNTIRVRSTGNVAIATALENGDTLNGVTLATGNHVFLGSQTAPAENGIYTVVASGAASRASFADSAAELAAIGFRISEGTVGAGEQWTLPLASSAITVGTTALNFAQINNDNVSVRVGDNIAAGPDAGDSFTTATGVVALGVEAGRDTTSGADMVAIGRAAGRSNTTAGDGVFIGVGAGLTPTTTAPGAVCVGAYAGAYGPLGARTVLVGKSAGDYLDGDDCVVVGNTALSTSGVSGDRVTAIGNYAGNGAGGAQFACTWLGYNAAGPSLGHVAGANQMALGASSYCTAENQIALGDDSVEDVRLFGMIALRANATTRSFFAGNAGNRSSGNQGCIGIGEAVLSASTTSTNIIGIGDRALESHTGSNGVVAIGSNAMRESLTINDSVVIGDNALRDATTGVGNTNIGLRTMAYATQARNCTSLGDSALWRYQGTGGIGIGYVVAELTQSGDHSIYIGTAAGRNCLSGDYRIMIGTEAGGFHNAPGVDIEANTGAVAGGARALGIGYRALAQTGGADFVAIGHEAGYSLTGGSTSIFIGSGAGKNASQKVDAVNQIVIGDDAFGTLDNEITLGNSSHTRTVLRGVQKGTTYTVATLPSASGTTAGAGARAFVTDANATTFASIVAGGGANGVPVYSDGTNWRIG